MAACIRAGVVPAIESDPGQTKSASMESFAQSQGWRHVCITGSNRDRSDYLGIPFEVKGETGYLPLSWVNRLNEHTNGALLMMDDFRDCSEEVMQAAHRILQERVVGDIPLLPHVAIVLAFNPLDTSTGGLELSPAVANRVCHLTWTPDVQSWLDGMMFGFESLHFPKIEQIAPHNPVWAAQMRSLVVSFCTANEQLINATPEDPDARAKGWPSMRTWDKVASVLSFVDADDVAVRRAVLTGLIGEGTGSAFLTWYASQDLINPMDAINNPSIIPWTTATPDRIFALASSMAALVRNRGEAKLWEKAALAAVTGVSAGMVDNAFIMATSLNNHMVAGARTPPAFVRAFGDLLVTAGTLTAAAS